MTPQPLSVAETKKMLRLASLIGTDSPRAEVNFLNALTGLIQKERLDTIKRIQKSEHWEKCETCMDCAGSLAVQGEKNRIALLDNQRKEMTKLPPMLCGLCGFKCYGAGAADDMTAHMIPEHGTNQAAEAKGIESETFKPTPSATTKATTNNKETKCY